MASTSTASADTTESTAHTFRETVERAAPLTMDLLCRELKAINEVLHYAKNNIDDMHPDEREHHTFDRGEIREIGQNLRQKVADAKEDADAGDDRWGEITLTAREIVAIEDGLVLAMTEDRFNHKKRHQRLDNRLTTETASHTSC